MDPVTFKPDRASVIAVIVLFLGALPFGLAAPVASVVFVIPAGALIWILRARVVADGEAITICNGLRVRRLRWAAVDRFEIPKRGPVVLHSTAGTSMRLTALPRYDLPRLISVGQPSPPDEVAEEAVSNAEQA